MRALHLRWMSYSLLPLVSVMLCQAVFLRKFVCVTAAKAVGHPNESSFNGHDERISRNDPVF